MFFTLGLLVFPSQLGDVWLEGTVLALVAVVVARPLAAAWRPPSISFSAAERFVLGWAGLRGGVPVVLATFPVIEGVPDSREFFNIAFFAVVVSTVVQGATFEPLAKALGLTTRRAGAPGAARRERARSGGSGAEVVEFPVRPATPWSGASCVTSACRATRC